MTDISLQPLPVLLQANVPTPVPVQKGGVTIINRTSAILELCSDQNFTAPVSVPVGASMPWSTGTTLYALSTVGGTITVLPETFNYYDPNTISQPASQVVLLPQQNANLSNGSPPTYTFFVPLTASTRTIGISLTAPSGFIPVVTVYGSSAGMYYRLPAPMYLPGIGPNQWFAYVPVSPDVDPLIVVEVQGQTGTGGSIFTIEVFGDPLQYKEDVFYNGALSSAAIVTAVAGTFTLLSGPARVKSIFMDAGFNICGILLQPANITLMQVDARTGGGRSPNMDFGDGLILDVGESLEVSVPLAPTFSATATALYAYP